LDARSPKEREARGKGRENEVREIIKERRKKFFWKKKRTNQRKEQEKWN